MSRRADHLAREREVIPCRACAQNHPIHRVAQRGHKGKPRSWASVRPRVSWGMSVPCGMDSIRLRLTYDGIGPVHWVCTPGAFGLQDKDEALLAGQRGENGSVVFEITLQVKAGSSGEPVLSGPFAHGPPAGRFLYLSWAHPGRHGYAQRLKLPLSGLGWQQVREAVASGEPLVATLMDHQPRATSTGANIGGTRQVDWALGKA